MPTDQTDASTAAQPQTDAALSADLTAMVRLAAGPIMRSDPAPITSLVKALRGQVTSARMVPLLDALQVVVQERGWTWDAQEAYDLSVFYLKPPPEPTGPDAATAAATPAGLHATPFAWQDTIAPRQWLYGTHIIRRYVSVVIAPGGVGKSSWLIGEALCMVSGKPILHDPVHGANKRVWVYNLEDPRDELQMRVQAFMLRHGMTMADIGDRLYMDSGRDQELCLAIDDREGVRLLAPVVDQIIAEIQRRKIDVLIVDPFVSSHRVNENDNGAIDMVAKAWGRVADRADCAIVLVHHTRKMAAGRAADAESARGAVSLIGAARSVRVFSRLSEEDAQALDLPPNDSPGRYGKWYDDKNNLAPTAGRERYYRMDSYTLPNGESVGVPVVHDVPTPATMTFSESDLLQVYNAMSHEHGSHPAASDSLGAVVGAVLNYDHTAKPGSEFVAKAIKAMLTAGMIERATGIKPGNRSQRQVYRKLRLPSASASAAAARKESTPSPDENLFEDHVA